MILDQFVCLNHTRIWIKSTISEGNSIMKLHDRNMDYMNNLFKHSLEYGQDIYDQTFMHRHFFLISAAKARDWLIELADVDMELKEILKTLDDKFPDLRDVRNMNEHDISYYKGKGHKQKNFHKAVGNDFITDGTSIRVEGNDYLIGDRLNVQHVIDYFTQIYPIIKAKLDNIDY
ncbi:hypothetical protein [Virgibacillus ndiopensis]|uniref:hypothetical protein n=1 Tax=Virgibacillus ndiopensis TaxID=2004408 RepID=UPI000C07C7C4|nr:hypothetical protein [Virgibacillus ndiopensis]